MTATDEFLADVLPRLHAAEVALHEGDHAPRSAFWSHRDPVTLFGAEVNRSGWTEVEEAFAWVAGRFSSCTSIDYEVVAAGASGDLGYLVAIERIVAEVGGAEVTYALRATTVFRREDGAWKAVHRHGDRYE